MLRAWPEGCVLTTVVLGGFLWCQSLVLTEACLPLEEVMLCICFVLFTNKMAYFQTHTGYLGLLS